MGEVRKPRQREHVGDCYSLKCKHIFGLYYNRWQLGLIIRDKREMERKAYPVDEKLFNLLLAEDFDGLNAGELQKLFDDSSYEISDKWVFISDKTEREYQKESENYNIGYFFHSQGLYGYKYFSLIDYENNSTYKIGIPDVSKSNDIGVRQKSVTISKTNTNSVLPSEI